MHESEDLTEEPVLCRPRKVPLRFHEGSSGHVYTCPKEKYRHAYFEVLELALGEVDRRFEQSDFVMIRTIESLILDASNGKLVQISDDIKIFLTMTSIKIA